MNTLRFICSSQDYAQYFGARISNKIKHSWFGKLALTSFPAIQQLCRLAKVDVQVLALPTVSQLPSTSSINLVFTTELEPLLYHPDMHWPVRIDGREVFRLFVDKFAVYRRMQMASVVAQPHTVVVRGQADLITALKDITTPYVVLKPRFHTYASRNVLLLQRQRLEQLQAAERLNLSDYLLQAYRPDTLWPSVEWRFHFVGQRLCRCQRIVDKNNWAQAFLNGNIALADIPQQFRTAAEATAGWLIASDNPDNFTIDFLELEGQQLLFLEANCGCLNSFFIADAAEAEYIRPIFTELVHRYFS